MYNNLINVISKFLETYFLTFFLTLFLIILIKYLFLRPKFNIS